MIAANDIQNQSLVRLGQRQVILLLVGHIEFCRHRVRLQARRLHVRLHVDRHIGLHAQHQLVAVGSREQRTRHVLKLNADFGLRLVEALSALQVERNADPARRIHLATRHALSPLLQNRGGEGGGQTVLRHAGVVQVPRLRVVLDVLADHRVLQRHGLDRLQQPHLLVADVCAVERKRLLHRQQRHHLEQVVLHDVANDAVVVEVATATVHAQGLLEDDLHVVDVLATPESVDDHVGEARHQQVLHHLLAEVVVDTLGVRTRGGFYVDVFFGEELLDVCVEFAARVVVATEGLLHNEAVVALVLDARVYE